MGYLNMLKRHTIPYHTLAHPVYGQWRGGVHLVIAHKNSRKGVMYELISERWDEDRTCINYGKLI